MAATIFEELDSREGDNKSRLWKYKVFGATDEQEAIDLTNTTTPAVYQGLILDGVTVESIRQDGSGEANYPDNNIHDVEVSYTELPGNENAGAGGGSVAYSFSYQAPSAQILTSLETIQRYGIDPANDAVQLSPGDAKIPNFHQAIRVEGAGAKSKAQGISLPVPSPTNIWTFTVPESIVTDAYQQGVERIMGTTNKFQFKGRPAGSMLFVSCRGGVSTTDGIWQIEFGTSYSANKTDIKIGDVLTDIEKRGWELLWVLNESKDDTAAQQVILKPRAVYIERIFEESDFNILGF